MKVSLPFIPERPLLPLAACLHCFSSFCHETHLQTDSLSEMPSPNKKQAASAVISPTTSTKEEKTEKSDEDIKPLLKIFFRNTSFNLLTGSTVDPQLSCFNVTGFDFLDREMPAAKSITSSILAKGFPEGWLDETNLFPEEFDLNVELDLAVEFSLDAGLMMKEATDELIAQVHRLHLMMRLKKSVTFCLS